jgi:hypothetical protein
MKYIRNERGMALVMALILSLIALATVSVLLYLLTQGTTMSGFEKRYETSLEASKGGVDIVTKEIIPNLIGSQVISQSMNSLVGSSGFQLINLNFPFTSANCLQNKLLITTKTGLTDNWASCASPDNESPVLKKSDGTIVADVSFRLSGLTAAQDYNVYAKIVDTVAGNTSTSGLDLEGQGVVESGSGMVTPKQVPYMYRLEVQAERAANPDERSNLSVLYAY